MIKRYNNLSLAIAIPGLIIQIAGRFIMDSGQEALGLVMFIGGTVMLLWYLAGFLSLIGLIILALLKDHSGVNEV
ncbi:hypothetical protein [Gimesia maris]|uniref:Uncharacterized protein n=1 Tax=Gimesia maris TaxID=122 RepID=A0ABX5YSX4_9PLAN|nr:hypothetical protein [Gimesia maris]EDL60192.1 hypothetical protein PM8797T_20623 [Gimesia maris DSM 8797]QDU16651.1 hypothetical protein CA11_44830 [Gimesia maris]QEG18692.1 hypothetical protein GmarT_45820 [Gimesia maris]QGQ28364.1 hypothetical protein F1729_06730 [Gimesia maris]